MMNPAANPAFEAALKSKIDGKTKPLGALGRIEALAAQIARLQGSLEPRIESCALVIFAGDHGIAAEGVSLFPQAVTRQMVMNFLDGGAAANVFARSLGVRLLIVDCGIAGGPIADPRLIVRRIGDGTANSVAGPAMSRAEAVSALEAGEEIAAALGEPAAAFGEMGIANTSAASLVLHKLLGLPLAALTGRGTGLDEAGVAHKLEVLSRAAGRTPDRLDPLPAISEYGGFEIAVMAGAMLGAARRRRLVLVDGFIAAAAAATALALDPSVHGALVFAHRSAEAGHLAALKALDAEPLFDFAMRLGEGTGALLAYPIVRAAAAMLSEMASFEDAGVSGPEG